MRIELSENCRNSFRLLLAVEKTKIVRMEPIIAQLKNQFSQLFSLSLNFKCLFATRKRGVGVKPV